MHGSSSVLPASSHGHALMLHAKRCIRKPDGFSFRAAHAFSKPVRKLEPSNALQQTGGRLLLRTTVDDDTPLRHRCAVHRSFAQAQNNADLSNVQALDHWRNASSHRRSCLMTLPALPNAPPCVLSYLRYLGRASLVEIPLCMTFGGRATRRCPSSALGSGCTSASCSFSAL